MDMLGGGSMQDLSLHLLDIVENSIRAGAMKIEIQIIEAIESDSLSFKVSDNGKGMSKEMLSRVIDPFVTTRTSRRVGLGIPLLYQNCLNIGGDFLIKSQEQKGTQLEVIMPYSHIDRLPLGDIASSLTVLIQANPNIDLIYQHTYNKRNFFFQTTEIKLILDGVAINSPEIVRWLRQYIKEQLKNLYEQ